MVYPSKNSDSASFTPQRVFGMNPSGAGPKAAHGAASAPRVSLRRFDVTDQRLLDSIDGADALCTPEIMAQVLQKNKQRILRGLMWFEPPNTKSAAVIKSGQAPWRDKSFPIDKTQQEFVLQLSEALQLDEVQAFQQFQNYLRTEVKGQRFEYEMSTIEDILAFYMEERLSILKCGSRLLRGMMDESYGYRNEATFIVKQLLAEKWLVEVKKQYELVTKLVVPSRMPRAFAERWATQYVLEQAEILEVVLHLYYDVVERGMKEFLVWCDLFSKEAFGARQTNYSALTEEGRATTRRIKYLTVLILLEMMDLEMYTGNEFYEGLNHLTTPTGAPIPMSDPSNSSQTTNGKVNTRKFIAEFPAVDAVLSQWGSVDAHGPILLAWSALLSRVGQEMTARLGISVSSGSLSSSASSGSGILYGSSSSSSQDLVIDKLVSHTEYGRRATQLKAVDFILKLLREEESLYGGGRGGSLLAHKSILSGWMISMTTAFCPEDLPFYHSLVDLHCEIYRNEAALCNHFWRMFSETGHLRALLDVASERFPYEFLPLIQLLTSLAADPQSASTVFFYLCDLLTYSQALPEADRANGVAFLKPPYQLVIPASVPFAIGNDASLFVTSTRTIEVDMITIPTHAFARVLSLDTQERPVLLQWAYPHSAWLLFINFIDSFLAQFTSSFVTNIPDQDIALLTGIVQLIAQLFSLQPLMASTVHDHLLDVAHRLFGTPPSMGSEQELFLLPRMFQILYTCAYLPKPPLALLTATLVCIKGMAVHHPTPVWAHFRRGLVDTAEQSSLFLPGPIRHTLEHECSIGTYPVTLAWLDLAECLIAFLQRWSTSAQDPLSGVSFDTSDFLPSLTYIQTALFSQYETWRYTSIQHKSALGLTILRIFERLLDDVPQSDPSAPKTPNMTNPQHTNILSTVQSTQKDAQSGNRVWIQETLFNSLLYDVSFHTNILNIISMGPVALEWNQRRMKGGSTLVELIKSAFTVLESVLLLKQRAHVDESPSPKSSKSTTAKSAMDVDAGNGPAASADLTSEITPLESSILQRKVGKYGLDLVYVIASYISYNYDARIPSKATELLTILCRLSKASLPHSHGMDVSEGSSKSFSRHGTANAHTQGSSSNADSSVAMATAKTSPVSLASYFGSMADTLRSEFLWRLSDSREPSFLRIAIWRLMTESLASQPGLAELFINIQADPIEPMSAPESAAAGTKMSIAPGAAKGATATKGPASSTTPASLSIPTSSVIVVLNLFMDDEQRNWYLKNDPRLLSEAFSFLAALWHVASDHLSIFSQIRSRPNFWLKMLSCLSTSEGSSASLKTASKTLQDALETSKKTQAASSNEMAMSISQPDQPKKLPLDVVNSQCYRLLIDAFVFNILALEIFFVSHNGSLDEGLVVELGKLLTEKPRLLGLLDEFSELALETTGSSRDARELLIKTLHWLNIDMSLLSHFPNKRIFGSEYLFNTRLLKKKLGLSNMNTMSEDEVSESPGTGDAAKSRFGLPATNATLTSYDHFTNEHIDVMERISLANVELSYTEAKIRALRSFEQFFHTLIVRQSKLQLPEVDMLLLMSKVLAMKIGRERRESTAAFNNMKEMCSILLLSVQRWCKIFRIASATAAQNPTSSSAPSLSSISKPSVTTQSALSGLISETISESIYVILSSLHDALFWLSSKAMSSEICHTILTILHSVMDTFSTWNDRMQSVSIPIAATCVDLLERGHLFGTSLSLLNVIFTHNEHPSALLRCLTERNTLGVLVSELETSLSLQVEAERVEAILYFFISIVTASNELSDSLASYGILKCLRTEAWAGFVRERMLEYLDSGERNPWHKNWTLVLTLTTLLLRSLKYAQDTVVQSLEFVSTHAPRLLHSLETHHSRFQESSQHQAQTGGFNSGSSAMDISQQGSARNTNRGSGRNPFAVHVPTTPNSSSQFFGAKMNRGGMTGGRASAPAPSVAATPNGKSTHYAASSGFGVTNALHPIKAVESAPSITLAALEETERVTALTYELGRYRSRWRLALESPRGNVAEHLEQQILHLFQRVSLLISHHADIVSTAKAVSQQERKSLAAAAAAASKAAKEDEESKAKKVDTKTSATTSTTAAPTAAPGPKKVAFQSIPQIKVFGAKPESGATDGAPSGTKQPADEDAAKAQAQAKSTEESSADEKSQEKDSSSKPDEAPVVPSSAQAPGSRSLAQSQMITKEGNGATPASSAASSGKEKSPLAAAAASTSAMSAPKEAPFLEKVELYLFRILRNTISLVRLFTPSVFSSASLTRPASSTHGEVDEQRDISTMVPVFMPLTEETIAPLPSLGLLSKLVSSCVLHLKKLTTVSSSSASSSKPNGALATSAIPASVPHQLLAPHLSEEFSLSLYAIESAVFILLAHIHLYNHPSNPDELIRRRVRDELGYELESTISILMKDWNRFSAAPIPLFLQKAQQYLQSIQRR